MDGTPLDPAHFVRHIVSRRLVFTQSARRHRVGRGRVREAIADPLISIIHHPRSAAERGRVLIIGSDQTGRVFEIVVVPLDDETTLVIHVMDARDKYRRLLSGGPT